jgi:hypothetical protein
VATPLLFSRNNNLTNGRFIFILRAGCIYPILMEVTMMLELMTIFAVCIGSSRATLVNMRSWGQRPEQTNEKSSDSSDEEDKARSNRAAKIFEFLDSLSDRKPKA